jgi:arylsulfatase
MAAEFCRIAKTTLEFSRRAALWLVALAAVTLPSAFARSADAKPNVVILLADDLGYSDLGCFGSEIKTPNVDALAAGGLRFTQFYNTARCWPSRGALLTGYYAQQIRRDTLSGIPSGSRGVRPAWAPLLPTLLKPLGYRSYHSGKWHIDGQPLENGFDHSYRLDDAGRYFSPRGHAEDGRPLPQPDPTSGFYTTTAIADHAIRCLKEHGEQHSGQPFFSYVAFTAPHFPLHAIQKDIERYKETYTRGWNAMQRERYERQKKLGLVSHDLPPMEEDVGPPYHFPEALKKLGPGEINRPLPWTELTDEQRAFQAAKMAVHAAMIDRMDQEIGRIIAQLKAMNALENTLILFASDNGASAEIMVRDDGHDPASLPGSAASHLCLGPGWSSCSNTPLRRHKTWVHEGGISTPLIAHWPDGIAAKGDLRHLPFHLIDIVPTVLEIAGAAPALREEVGDGSPLAAPPRPGRSLRAAFADSAAATARDLWWSHEGNRALRRGDLKLVAIKDGPWELYDLSVDRGEAHNLAAEQPETVRVLAAAWQLMENDFRKQASTDAPPQPDGGAKGAKTGKRK